MVSIPALNAFIPDCTGMTAGRSDSGFGAYRNVSISQRRNMNIAVRTVEGDSVTINSGSRFEAGFSAFNQHGTIDGDSVDFTARSFECSSARSLSFTIEGTIEKEEARDIHKAMHQVDKLIWRLQSGDLKHAMKRVSKLYRLDSIAGLEAAVQSSCSVSFAEAEATESVAAPVSELSCSAEEPAAAVDDA